MNEQDPTPFVDQSALKVNQTFIIMLLIGAFLLDSWLLVAFVSMVMLVGSVIPKLALFKQIYRRILKPANFVKSRIIPDYPEPHRFAQGFGGTVLVISVITLLLSQSLLGWLFTWVVIALAALNLILGFCAGCFVYYQLNRLNVPGFKHRAIRQS